MKNLAPSAAKGVDTEQDLWKKFDEEAAKKKSTLSPGLPPAQFYTLPYHSVQGPHHQTSFAKHEDEKHLGKNISIDRTENSSSEQATAKTDNYQQTISNLSGSLSKIISLGVGFLSTGMQIGNKLINDLSVSPTAHSQMNMGHNAYQTHSDCECGHTQNMNHCGCCSCMNPGVHHGR
jgi:hypothetical protein